ncbi:MAG: AAA family ATPase [Bacilli bacterium]|nr:AAA family ATPase [Bacilli bacterium]
MVEKKEFVVLFIKKNINESVTEFIPHRVVEGIYDKENNWFNDTKDGIPYLHIDITPSSTVGYGLRTTIELQKESISDELLESIKKEMLDYANKFTYQRDLSRTESIMATDKETGDITIFTDVDNVDNFTQNKKSGSDEILDMIPLDLEEKIKKTIKGQDEAVRKIVTALWTTINFRNLKKKNMLIIGPTGVGKTAIFKKIKEILNIPLVIFPIPGLSQAGYVGRSVDEILKQVYYESDENLDLAEHSIVILDEIDKLAKNTNGTGEVATIAVQNELLKIIEGCQRFVEATNPRDPSFMIDTSNIIFVGTGAFQELFEKEKANLGFVESTTKNPKKKEINTDRLRTYGLKRELLGRLPIIVELDKLDKVALKDIILNSDESELLETLDALKQLGIEVENIDEVIDIIIDDAIEKQIGARGLIATINNMFSEIFYEVGNNQGKYNSVTIGPNIIKDNKDYKLDRKQNKTRKKEK